jgi:PPOX class probable FMN-dependent enzyme
VKEPTVSIDLRSRYEFANERVLKKQLPRLEKHSRAFIARSPFLVLASTDRDGRLDASPRGDAPGFVQIIDDDTLAIPDRPGNNRLDTLDNVSANPHVGMIFFVPGMNETLRVNGQARITFEPALLESLGFNGKPARSALVVKTEEVFFHCGKALIRADLWNPDKHIERRAFPTLGSIITDIVGGDAEAAAAADLRVDDDYRTRLY